MRSPRACLNRTRRTLAENDLGGATAAIDLSIANTYEFAVRYRVFR